VWTRLIGALAVAFVALLRSVWRVARELFHEITGALFGLFAVVGAASAWREWRRGSAEWTIGLALGFTVMMIAFAVASFRSARRVR